ncbi:MAG: N-acetylneuraminate synthase family protein [Leptospiraceae bacterium]|nr:N-acetylneuraminate synthase family protein [Leptospiraceae bacterium]MCK6381601.1 N-acetylneuraminate synthase family protein [Leptospiraceae bacterium]NUM41477.1 N-acetylneuraminate synthase family protein [Leptospiraceae bacterium]
MLKDYFKIGKQSHTIGGDLSPFLIAEIGLNHNGDLDIGKRTIAEAGKCGATAVKFQSYITEEFINKSNPDAKFLFDIFKQYELSEKMHREFQKTALDEGLEFFSTPLCETSVDFLVSLNVPILKIASGDIVNFQLLEKCASTKIPIFLSTGAAELSEIVKSLEYLQENEVSELCLMHCVSVYPAPIESLNLKTILLLQEIANCPVGFSDHSEGSIGATIAIAYNASVIEKHFTLDKSLPGPDHCISVSPEEFRVFSKNCKEAFLARGKKAKVLHEKEKESKFFGRRSLYIDKNKNPIALRPNLSVKDRAILDSKDYIKLQETKPSFLELKADSPIYFKDLHG